LVVLAAGLRTRNDCGPRRDLGLGRQHRHERCRGMVRALRRDVRVGAVLLISAHPRDGPRQRAPRGPSSACVLVRLIFLNGSVTDGREGSNARICGDAGAKAAPRSCRATCPNGQVQGQLLRTRTTSAERTCTFRAEVSRMGRFRPEMSAISKRIPARDVPFRCRQTSSGRGIVSSRAVG
jgi:hypothetical protein